MELVFEFSLEGTLGDSATVGSGPFGRRAFGRLVEGTVTGERLSGRIAAGGDDWALVGADGYLRPDVRVLVQTHDGAGIYLSYTGVIEMNAAVRAALAGDGATGFGDQYWRCTPRLETGDPRYAWVNQAVFVSEGRFTSARSVEYRVYRVA